MYVHYWTMAVSDRGVPVLFRWRDCDPFFFGTSKKWAHSAKTKETVEDVPLDMADMGLSMSVKYIVPAWWLQSIKNISEKP